MSQQATIKLLHILNASSFQKLLVLSSSTNCLPHIIKILAFIWSQFQVLALLARTITWCLFVEVPHLVILVAKYLFSANLFAYMNSQKITLGMLVMALLYLISPTVFVIWIFYALKKRLTVPDFVIITWKAFADLHVLIVYFPLHINTSILFENKHIASKAAEPSPKIEENCPVMVLKFWTDNPHFGDFDFL